MYITRVPNRGSPPAVLLRESYREGGKVKNRTVANLSSWPEAKVEALARALKGLPPAGLEGMIEVTRSLPHGHVAAVLGTIRSLGLEELIDPARLAAAGPGDRDDHRRGDRRVVQAGHRAGAARRRPRPARWARLLGLDSCDEDDLYAAMDWLLPRQQQHRGRAGRPAPGRRHAGAV